MKHLLLVLVVMVGLRVSAQGKEALKKTVEALSKTKTVKKATKKIEKKIINVLPVEKETAAVIGSTALTLVNGEINTKQIKNLNVKLMGGKLRPDVTYDFKNGETTGNIKIDWKW